MTCRSLGGFGWACSRGRVATCSTPGCGRSANLLCDFPLAGKKAGKTCDRPICSSCATRVAPNVDHCRTHATMKPPDPDPFEGIFPCDE